MAPVNILCPYTGSFTLWFYIFSVGSLNIKLIFKFLQAAGGAFVRVISLCFIKSHHENNSRIFGTLFFFFSVWDFFGFFHHFESSLNSGFEIFWWDTFYTKTFGPIPKQFEFLLCPGTLRSMKWILVSYQYFFILPLPAKCFWVTAAQWAHSPYLVLLLAQDQPISIKK